MQLMLNIQVVDAREAQKTGKITLRFPAKSATLEAAETATLTLTRLNLFRSFPAAPFQKVQVPHDISSPTHKSLCLALCRFAK